MKTTHATRGSSTDGGMRKEQKTQFPAANGHDRSASVQVTMRIGKTRFKAGSDPILVSTVEADIAIGEDQVTCSMKVGSGTGCPQ